MLTSMATHVDMCFNSACESKCRRHVVVHGVMHRHLILRQYAQQLSERELEQLAERTGGMSGRDLRDVCEHTERRWASKVREGSWALCGWMKMKIARGRQDEAGKQ